MASFLEVNQVPFLGTTVTLQLETKPRETARNFERKFDAQGARGCGQQNLRFPELQNTPALAGVFASGSRRCALYVSPCT